MDRPKKIIRKTIRISEETYQVTCWFLSQWPKAHAKTFSGFLEDLLTREMGKVLGNRLGVPKLIKLVPELKEISSQTNQSKLGNVRHDSLKAV